MTTVSRKNIYLARHGERMDWIDKTWTTKAERPSDPPLSLYGQQQAKELGEYVAQIEPRITHIYASPFLRTIQTALQIVRELNKKCASSEDFIKIRLEPGFSEYFFEEYNQNSIFRPSNQLADVQQNISYFDEDYDSVLKADYYLQIKTETRQQLRDRLKQTLQNVLNSHMNDCNILIVTHAAPLIEGARALATIDKVENGSGTNIKENKITSNMSTWEMLPIRPGVCSITHFELVDTNWTLSKNGHSSYLSKGEQNVWIFPDDISLYKPL